MTLAERTIVAECDDRSFFSDLFVAFGGVAPNAKRVEGEPFLRVTIETATGDGWAVLTMRHRGEVLDPSRFFFGLSLPDCPYRLMESYGNGWVAVGFRGDDTPRFRYNSERCLVRLADGWPAAVVALLFRGFLALADDAIFFHASAVGIGGNGVLFVGAQRSGKSTLALALVARGHEFLSDEIGCYRPSTGEILPYRRPVGIREGVRSERIEKPLAEKRYRGMIHDGSLRVDLETLLPLPPARPLPLEAVIFLRGFAAEPSIESITPGREEVGMLQALYSSLTNAPSTRRVFELIQLLARARIYGLNPGAPDETASFLEEVMQAK